MTDKNHSYESSDEDDELVVDTDSQSSEYPQSQSSEDTDIEESTQKSVNEPNEKQSITVKRPTANPSRYRDYPIYYLHLIVSICIPYLLFAAQVIGEKIEGFTKKFVKFMQLVGENIWRRDQNNKRGSLNYYFDMVTVGIANIIYKAYPFSEESHTQKLPFDNFNEFKKNLERIDSEVTVDLYVIRTLMISAIGGFLGIVFGYFVARLLATELSDLTLGLTALPTWLRVWGAENYEIIVIPLVTVSIGLIVAGVIYYIIKQYLAYLVREMNREIRDIYPQGVKFMYALAVTGATVKDIIYTTADQKKNYGIFATEMEDVRQKIEKENVNLVDAMEQKAAETSSRYIEELLKDLVTVVESGVSPVDTLRAKHSESINKNKRNQEEKAQKKEFLVQGILMTTVFMIFFVLVEFVMSFLAEPSLNLLVMLATVFVFMMWGMFSLMIKLFDRSVEVSDPKIERIIQLYRHTYTRPIEFVQQHNGIEQREIHKNHLNSWHHKWSRRLMYWYAEVKYMVLSPIKRMRNDPRVAFFISIPLALLYIVFVAGFTITELDLLGVMIPVPTTTPFSSFETNPILVWVAQVGVPIFITIIPPAIFQELKARRQNEIFSGLDSLMKAIKQSIKTGQTIDDSLESYESNASEYLQRELNRTTNHINWFNDIDEALVMLNNRIKIPEFTRTMTMVITSNRISGDIRESLDVASEDIRRANELRKSKKSSGTQFAVLLFVVFILAAFILLLVLGLFIPIMESAMPEEGGEQISFFGGLQIDFFSALITVLLLDLAVVLGLLSGQLKSQRILAGVKYAGLYTLIMIVLLYAVELIDITVIVG